MRRVVPIPPPTDPAVTDATAFGEAIRAARTHVGMPLADLALTLGISKQTLSDLETARASVGLATALRVARELGIGVFALFADEREPFRRQIVKSRSRPQS